MLSCKEMVGLLSDQLERTLPWRQRLAMGLHLVICHNCRRYRQHLVFLQKLLIGRGSFWQLSVTAKQRISEKLRGQIDE